MACRPRRPPLWPGAASPRQEGRRDRLRNGTPRQQNRLRLGPGPVQLRPRPLGLTTPRGFLDRCPPRRAQQRSTWSARSAARTNEVDRDEQRRTIGRRGSPRKELIWSLSQPCLPVRRWTARRAGTRRCDYGGHPRCYAASSLAPSPPRQPERRQLTHDHDQEVAYRQCGRQGHPPTPGNGLTNPIRPHTAGEPSTPLPRLDTSHRQLGERMARSGDLRTDQGPRSLGPSPTASGSVPRPM